MTVSACAQTGSPEEIEIGDDGKADGEAKPLGTYLDATLIPVDCPEGSEAPIMRLVILRSDATFIRVDMDCGHAGEDVEHAGTYKLTRSGDKRFIRFLGDDDQLIDRWEYRLHPDDVLEVRRTNSTTWAKLPKSLFAFCAEPADCELQGDIEHAECDAEGAWACEINTCTYTCAGEPSDPDEPTEPDPSTNACEAAGGTCIGLNPTACADGVILPADEFSCGGPVGVMCCLQ